MPDLDLEWFVDEISNSVRGGRTPDDAYRRLLLAVQEPHQELLRNALKEFYERTGRIRKLKKPVCLQSTRLSNWYPGPGKNDIFWPAYKDYLLNNKGWAQNTVDSVDQSSTKITALLQPPGLAKIDTRGLVVGYVQSGKTANFTAVISKCADINYKFFLVLAGLTNVLRSQTQARLERELVNLNRQHWVTLTTFDQDFSPGPIGNVDAFLTDHQNLKVLGVVKKNAWVLRRLLSWLKTASAEVLGNCPVLIIDDEADQASLNTAKYEEERTTINRLLMEVLDTLPKASYVGYTASPFANVLVDPTYPEGLYPRDFIVDLPIPDGYFGPESIFGRAALEEEEEQKIQGAFDLVRIIPDQEALLLKPRGLKDYETFEPTLTESLKSSLRYFWLATAARWARGDKGQHSTMLIHTTLFIKVHERFRPLIENYRKRVLRIMKEDGKEHAEISTFEEQWRREQDRVPSMEMEIQPTKFKDLRPFLHEVVTETRVVVENSEADDRLIYDDDPKIQVAIGGNTLSRGLTLTGLVVSLFVRASTAYDTLLQMGRWFGYREGYSDLPRIWMTEELEEWFYHLATVEQEIRNDIQRYERENLTPTEFSVRIRKHHALSVTSRMKMQAATTAYMTYSGARLQTLLFKHKDPTWLKTNQRAASNLILAIKSNGASSRRHRNSLLFEDIPADHIINFINEYQVHEDSSDLQSNLLVGYINDQLKNGDLHKWNIVVRGKYESDDIESYEISKGIRVPLLNRSRRLIGIYREDTARLGTLMTGGDRVIDLNLTTAEIRKLSEDELQAKRPLHKGLLILYPINKDSIPSQPTPAVSRKGRFVPLEATDHIIGVGLVFPSTDDLTPQEYLTVDLSRIEREEFDIPMDEPNGDTE